MAKKCVKIPMIMSNSSVGSLRGIKGGVEVCGVRGSKVLVECGVNFAETKGLWVTQKWITYLSIRDKKAVSNEYGTSSL